LYEEREYLKSKGYTENGVTDDYYYGTVLLDGSGTYYEKVIYRDAARKIYEDKTETQQENLNKALSDAREYEFQEINMINIQKSNRIAELRETARKEIARLSSTGLSSSNNNGNTGELIDYNNMVNYNDVTALSTVGISFNPFLWLL
jgi:hypothetical protein